MSNGSPLPAGTVTMLFTDIEGSTRLLKQLGHEYGELLAAHRRILRESFSAHEGRELGTEGDSFFVVLARAGAAVEAALDAQRRLAAHDWPDGVECRIRMGLHTGEPVVGEEGYHGMGLHRAARIAASAHGGQILLSTATAELLKDDLPAGLSLRDLGLQRLKDIDGPERIFQAVAEGLRSDFAAPRTASPGRSRRRPALVVAVVAVAVAVAAVVAAATGLRHGGHRAAATPAVPIRANTVVRLDPRTGRVTASFPAGATPEAVLAEPGAIWAVAYQDATVRRIVRTTGAQTAVSTSSPATALAGGDGAVWALSPFDPSLVRFDSRTGRLTDRIPVGPDPTAIAAGQGAVFVTSQESGTVTRVDGRTLAAVVLRRHLAGPDGIVAAGDAVWVALTFGQKLIELDA